MTELSRIFGIICILAATGFIVAIHMNQRARFSTGLKITLTLLSVILMTTGWLLLQ